MYVIRIHVQTVNCDVISQCDLGEQFGNTLADLTAQDRLAVLGTPDQVVLGVINRVRSPAQGHACSIARTVTS